MVCYITVIYSLLSQRFWISWHIFWRYSITLIMSSYIWHKYIPFVNIPFRCCAEKA